MIALLCKSWHQNISTFYLVVHELIINVKILCIGLRVYIRKSNITYSWEEGAILAIRNACLFFHFLGTVHATESMNTQVKQRFLSQLGGLSGELSERLHALCVEIQARRVKQAYLYVIVRFGYGEWGTHDNLNPTIDSFLNLFSCRIFNHEPWCY